MIHQKERALEHQCPPLYYRIMQISPPLPSLMMRVRVS